ncbi:MAG: two pore domain potassium channel family protein [Ruminococcus sp.]|nr:two pore domain potassium channel family protein [Ruminococcus sp.]
MINLKRLFRVMKRTGMIKIALGFFLILLIAAFILRFVEPDIHNIGEGFWYCFVASMTIGFSDFVATNIISRIITIIITLYGVLVVAMIPGVIVSYYTEYLRVKEKDTISTFLEKLEHLPELSKEELVEISEKVKRFNKK